MGSMIENLSTSLSTCEGITAFVGVIIGALLSLGMTCWVESLRKPKLKIRIPPNPWYRVYHYDRERKGETEEAVPFREARFLYLELYHKPVGWWASWMMRQSASSCDGYITFHHCKTKENLTVRPMPIRWPVREKPASDVETPPQIELYPGAKRPMDVVARIEDDEEIYGWNNQSYACWETNWRNRDYQIPKGVCYVAITVRSYGLQFQNVFRLDNSGAKNRIRFKSVNFFTTLRILRKLNSTRPYSPQDDDGAYIQ
jgi:hypothetical protein